MHMKHTLARGALLAAGLAFAGCTKAPEKAPATAPAKQVSAADHSHDGWWCDEHGVPEEECTRCDSSLVSKYKDKGDWCKKHDLPDSQCFVCHPEHEAQFAARYEAKYGKKPPKPQSEG